MVQCPNTDETHHTTITIMCVVSGAGHMLHPKNYKSTDALNYNYYSTLSFKVPF